MLQNKKKYFSSGLYIKMLQITRKNYFKCDLETIINNDSQYFWINLRNFEAKTERKWLNMFNKHGNKSTMKYIKKLKPILSFGLIEYL